MSIEEIIRELLVTVQGDQALLDALTSGDDMRRLSSGMVVGPANRLVELLAGQFSISEEARVARELEDQD